MFDVLRAHVRTAFGRVLTSASTTLREAFRAAPLVRGFAEDLLRSPQELIAQNVALRQQLIVAARGVKRPNLGPLDRGLLVALASILPRWRDALLLVKPETVLRWHRQDPTVLEAEVQGRGGSLAADRRRHLRADAGAGIHRPRMSFRWRGLSRVPSRSKVSASPTATLDHENPASA